MLTSAERPVSDLGHDDLVLPFAVTPLDIRGRVVRLGPAVDRILKQHDYPEPVSRLGGEAAALTALLGSSLKIEGRFQLQTKTDGAVDMLVVDFDAPDRLRAFARFDAARVAAAGGHPGSAELLGQGHLALTIDQGGDMSRYQGVVPLEGQGLEAAAHQYFAQSEQIPTLVRLAVGQNVTGAGSEWRAGGLLAQFLPESEDRRRQFDLDPGDAPEGFVRAAPEDDELVDPTLSSERLLFRLFHERGVTVFGGQAMHDACRCSRERIDGMLRSFSADERRDMVGPDGRIGVTCEFCGVHRDFDPADFDAPH